MAVRRHRLVSLLLAANLLTLVGCGQAPALNAAAVPQKAPVARQAAPAQAPAVTLTRGQAPVAIAPAATRPAPNLVLAPPAELFASDYAESRYLAVKDQPADPEVTRELKAQLSVDGGLSWGKIGGGIGAGLLGAGFLGYFVYAGQVGAKDLMTPVKDTFTKDPGAYGVAFQDVKFHSHDGLKLAGWYVPAAVPTDKGLVIFHGHSSNKDTMYKKYGHWLRQKYNLFLYDSRYHGQSEGKYTTLGYYERKDAQIAIDQLRARGNTSVGLLGESMGGAVAISAGAVDKGVKAVWSDCAFDSLQDAIAPRAAARKYPMAAGVGRAVVATVSVKARARVATADPIRFVEQIAPRPLYLVHGQKDDDTTPMNSEKLFEKAKGPKEIWRTPDADHAQSVDMYADEYKARTFNFFDAAL